MASLTSRLQALPKELYEIIFKFTFMPKSGSIKIDEEYQPPNNIQVNKLTRKTATELYYSQTTFKMDRDLLVKFVTSLSYAHVRMLTDVTIDDRDMLFKKVPKITDRIAIHDECQKIHNMLPDRYKKKIELNVIKVSVRTERDLKTVRTGAKDIDVHFPLAELLNDDDSESEFDSDEHEFMGRMLAKGLSLG